MKKYVPLFIALEIVFSFSSFAQQSGSVSDNSKKENTEQMLDKTPDDELGVAYYHVVEKIKTSSGTFVTIYDVSSLSLVETYDLGPNNTRVITPKYLTPKVKIKRNVVSKINEDVVLNIVPKPPVAKITIAEDPIKAAVAILDKKEKFVIIDILSTYERILEKGYQSVDMLKKVANKRYFQGDLVTAAKWYSQLFAATKDLEAEFYYRYAQSLISVGRTDKANEMMKKFEEKK